MSRIIDILSKQLTAAEMLLQKVMAIPDGRQGMYAVNYDKNTVRSISNEEEEWKNETNECLILFFGEDSRQVDGFNRCLREKSHYTDFREDLKRDLDKSIAFLKALVKADEIKAQVEEKGSLSHKAKTPMVFISHSFKDKEFVEALVELLENIGLDSSNMFCSSVNGYGVGLSKDIFETLRGLFNDYNLYVIFVHSPNYYNSPISLNEMGAAWVLKSDFCSFLTTNMELSGLKGVVNGNTIFIKVNNEDASARLTELKDHLISLFGLKDLDGIKWERKRNAFLKSVTSIQYASDATLEDAVKRVELAPEEIDVLKQWVESDNPYSRQQNFMGNRTVYYIGRQGFEVTKAEDEAEWEDLFERFKSLGFISLVRYDNSGKPQYKLKKAAFDYIKSLR